MRAGFFYLTEIELEIALDREGPVCEVEVREGKRHGTVRCDIRPKC